MLIVCNYSFLQVKKGRSNRREDIKREDIKREQLQFQISLQKQPPLRKFNFQVLQVIPIKINLKIIQNYLSLMSTLNNPQNFPSKTISPPQTESIPSNLSSVQEAAASAPQESTSDYLKKLLQRHTSKADYVSTFTNIMEQQCEDQIINGRYKIHKRQWSAEEERLKASRAAASRNTAEILHAKRQLQDQLEMIQGEIEDGERGNKSMSEEQRKAFLKRLQKEKKELLRKKEENAKLLQQRRAQEQRKQKEQRQREEAERRAKKQQEISERLKALEQARKRKQQEYRSQTALLKEKMKEKTTAIKIQQNYNIKQNETLQQRKKRLAQIRMLHKPIDRKELDAHAQKLQKLHAQRAAQAQSQKVIEKPVTFYKSIFYKRIKDEPKVFLDKLSQQQVSKLRENRDKLKKFSQHIRENYKPTIDEKKVEQMRFRSVNLRSNRSMSSVNPKENDHQKIGLRYLQFSKQQVDHQKLLGAERELTEEQEKPKKLDYLAELRKANKNRVSESAHDLLNKLEKVSISKQQKMKKILEFTDRIQKTAKRKEQLSRIGNGGVDDQLDALYLQAIQAKLGLLEQF